MIENEYKVVKLKTKFWDSPIFGVIFYTVCFLTLFIVVVLPVSIMNNPEKQLEYCVAQEIDTDLPEEVRDYDEVVFDLQEIKEQRKVLDEGADWKVYSVKFRCIDEESKTITTKDYVAFVYYKFVVGKYFRNGYFAILDCDLVKAN